MLPPSGEHGHLLGAASWMIGASSKVEIRAPKMCPWAFLVDFRAKGQYGIWIPALRGRI